jgi:Spy/CpxP family protein refolding chaperone
MTQLLSLFLLFGTQTAIADDSPARDMTRAQPRTAPRTPPLHRFLQRNAEELEIDEETLETIVAIAEDSREEISGLRQGLASAKEELETLLKEDEPNRRAVMAQVETLGMAEIAMRQAHLTTLMDIRALLTLEQREEIERRMTQRQLRQSARGRRGGERGERAERGQGGRSGERGPGRGQPERQPMDE